MNKLYILNDKAIEKLKLYKLQKVAETVGINYRTLSQMINQSRPCMKITAYCLTKFIDKDSEIKDYFIRKEK